MTATQPATFTLTLDIAEVLALVHETYLNQTYLAEPGRYERTGAPVPGRLDDAQVITDDPAFIGGTEMRLGSALEALFVRDALRTLGHRAERLWDTEDIYPGAPAFGHEVVITSMPLAECNALLYPRTNA